VKRSSGVLCHPTCMPGPNGIGELGDELIEFLTFLSSAGQSIWQILPLGPTGYGDSPYQPFSAFAGNPLLISLEGLVRDGVLSPGDAEARPAFPADRVDYGAVIAFKDRIFRSSWRLFQGASGKSLRGAWQDFCQASSTWLDDYALFMALKRHFGWATWVDWPREMALRESEGMGRWRAVLSEEIDYQRYLQFLFARQWSRVRCEAKERGIVVMGDMPIFVGHDSADVWSHPEIYYLDARGRPIVVAGVPPDRFSNTGQLWGNPLYRWDVLAADGYAWWLARLDHALSQVDLVRIDHFRGFCGYWEVPAGRETAEQGRWVRGPGKAFFDAVTAHLGALPIVVEDLGLISEDVIALRNELGLPGMRVLQFGFGGDSANPHLPHNYERGCVAYTATHDNDTTVGWYREQGEAIKHKARLYAGCPSEDIAWGFIRLVEESVADVAIVPLQDILGLGSEARLNWPGRASGNWAWRYATEALTPALAGALCDLCEASGRWTRPGVVLTGATSPRLDYKAPLSDRAE